jgi:hypothetical protein
MGEWMYRSIHFLPRHFSEVTVQFHEERAPGTHWIGGWVGPRTSLDDTERRRILTLPGLDLRPLASQPVASRYTDVHIAAS